MYFLDKVHENSKNKRVKMNIKPYNTLAISKQPIQYLTETQLNKLVYTFQLWYDNTPSFNKRRIRGRYWLTFLVLRFTGARIGEVLRLNDKIDIDFRNAEIRLITLKRHNPNKKGQFRFVPVPQSVTSEIATYLAEYPEQRGKTFHLDQGNFRKVFYKICDQAEIPKELAHPHILRHSRAIEMLRCGVPVTIVQDLLGHSSLVTTAIYLRISGQEVKTILKDKGLI